MILGWWVPVTGPENYEPCFLCRCAVHPLLPHTCTTRAWREALRYASEMEA